MLLEMTFGNFFSIKDQVRIDFRAGNMNTAAARGLSDNVFSVNGKTLLKVQGLFGANASGKTSVIKAASFCRQFVLDSFDNNQRTVFNYSPFKFDGYVEKPSTFLIDFISGGVEYEYSFSLLQNEILTEELYCYPNKRKVKVFTRDESKGPEKKHIYSFGEGQIPRPFDVAENTDKSVLFVSCANQMDREVAKTVYNYFSTELLVGLPVLSEKYATDLFNANRDTILQVLRMADSDIVDIHPLASGGFETKHRAQSEITFNLDTEESTGTIQLFNLLLLLMDVCINGKTLLLDDFDANMHTQLAEFVLSLVNASETAQLLFTSHNTHLMNIKKLRRDQIAFTNKREDGSTEVYSLFDFKDFRENMDAEKCYLQGRFDAVPYVNSSSGLMKSLLG